MHVVTELTKPKSLTDHKNVLSLAIGVPVSSLHWK